MILVSLFHPDSSGLTVCHTKGKAELIFSTLGFLFLGSYSGHRGVWKSQICQINELREPLTSAASSRITHGWWASWDLRRVRLNCTGQLLVLYLGFSHVVVPESKFFCSFWKLFIWKLKSPGFCPKLGYLESAWPPQLSWAEYLFFSYVSSKGNISGLFLCQNCRGSKVSLTPLGVWGGRTGFLIIRVF